MDHRMPTLDGLEAAQRIRKAKPWIKIVMTIADDSARPGANVAGLFFVEKPFSISTLRKTIEEALEL